MGIQSMGMDARQLVSKNKILSVWRRKKDHCVAMLFQLISL